MGSEIPEWAMEAADEVWTSLANNEANGRDAETALFARALVAAERRGIERSMAVHEREIGTINEFLGATEGDPLDTATYSRLILLLGSHHNALRTIRQLGDTP